MAYWTSKLGGRFLKEEIEKLDREHHAILGQLRKQPENSRCAECQEGGTMWASVNLGVFVCVRCSDVHRAVGTHISKVKGCTGTYLWGPDEIANMQAKGNAASARQYGSATPPHSAWKEERVKFAERKYSQPLEAQPPVGVEPAVVRADPARTASSLAEPQSQHHRQPVVAAEPAKVANSSDSLMSRALSPPPARTGAQPRKAAVAAPLLDLIDFDSLCGNMNDLDAGWGRVPEKARSKVGDFDGLLGPEAHATHVVPISSERSSDADLGKSLWNDFGAW